MSGSERAWAIELGAKSGGVETIRVGGESVVAILFS